MLKGYISVSLFNSTERPFAFTHRLLFKSTSHKLEWVVVCLHANTNMLNKIKVQDNILNGYEEDVLVI